MLRGPGVAAPALPRGGTPIRTFLRRFIDCPEDAIALLLLAGTLLFRWAFLADARFAGDEAWQYSTALSTAHLQMFPVTGVSVTGQDVQTPGGLYHLLMAIPLVLSSRPEAAMAWVALLNVAGLGLGWRLLRREYGPRAALGAVLLVAFNPFSVFFSDRQWNPNLLVPLGFAWLALMTSALRDGGRRTWGTLAGLLAVSPQIHLGCTHLVFLTLAAVAVARPKVPWRAVLLGGAIGVATYVPYFAWDAMRGFENTRGLFGHVAAAKAPLGEVGRALYHQVLYLAGDMTYALAKGFWFPMTEWGFLAGEGRARYAVFLGLPGAGGIALLAAIGTALAASVAAHLHLLASGVAGWVRRGRTFVREDPLAAIAILNLPVLAGSFLLARKAFYPHYTIMVLPLALVPAARLLGRVPARAALAALPILACVTVAQGVMVGRYYLREEAPVSVGVCVEAARVIADDAGDRPVAIEFAIPRTRMSPYSIEVAADRTWGQPLRVDGRSATRYRIVPAGSPEVAEATAAWDLGSAWVVRRGPAP